MEVSEFVAVLAPGEYRWFVLGVHLEAPIPKLKWIDQKYSSEGIDRCYIELHDCLKKKGRLLSREAIAKALEKMGNHDLADTICNPDTTGSTSEEELEPIAEEIDDQLKILVLNTYLQMRHINSLQGVCHIPVLPKQRAHFFAAMCTRMLDKDYTFKIYVLSKILKNIQETIGVVQKKTFIVQFFIEHVILQSKLIDFIKKKQQIIATENYQVVRLQTNEFWCHNTGVLMNEVLGKLYKFDPLPLQIILGNGCVCFNWIIPAFNAIELVPNLPLELVQIIGVISLHIGDTVIYNFGENSHETIEAAMQQGVKLRNTRAIELLLDVGCSPKVITHNENYAVTVIVNIKEKLCDSNDSGVDYVCILDYNEYVEAIVDPSSRAAECSSCILKDKMLKSLQREIDIYQQTQSNFGPYHTEQITSEIQTDMKDREITFLKKKIQSLNMEIDAKNEKIDQMQIMNRTKWKEKIPPPKSTAILPDPKLSTTGVVMNNRWWWWLMIFIVIFLHFNHSNFFRAVY